MLLVMEVNLGPGHTVLDGDSASPAKEAQQPLPLLAHVYCGHGPHLSYCWALVKILSPTHLALNFSQINITSHLKCVLHYLVKCLCSKIATTQSLRSELPCKPLPFKTVAEKNTHPSDPIMLLSSCIYSAAALWLVPIFYPDCLSCSAEQGRPRKFWGPPHSHVILQDTHRKVSLNSGN